MHTASITDLVPVTTSTSKILGHLFWWSLSGNHVSHADLTEIARQEGCPSNYLPCEVQPKGAFLRAIRTFKTKLPEQYEVIRVNEDKDVVAMGILSHKRDLTANRVETTHIANVVFEKKTSVFRVDAVNGAVPTTFETHFGKLFAYYRDHNTDDVRNILLKFFRDNAVMAREDGGVYFVPHMRTSTLNAIERVVRRVSAGNKTYPFPIVDNSVVREGMAEVAETGLGVEIATAERELAEFSFENCRDKTLTTRLEEYDALRGKVSLFAGLLTMKASSLTDRLDALSTVVRHYAKGGTAETAPRITAPETKMIAAPVEVEAFDVAAGF